MPHRPAIPDLPVADLHDYGVNQDHGTDRVERTGLPCLHIVKDPVSDLRHQFPRDVLPINIGQVRLDIAGRHALGIKRRDGLVEPGNSSLVRRHDRWLEGPLPIARYLHRDLANWVRTVFCVDPFLEFWPLRPWTSCLS